MASSGERKQEVKWAELTPLNPTFFSSSSSPDSCKFLHDRSDYKHGWQIERELEEGRYGANGEFPRTPSVAAALLLLRVCLLSTSALL